MARNDFTYLKILEILPVGTDGQRHRLVKAICTLCNSEIVVRKSRITGLEQQSCGCIHQYQPKKDVTGTTINGVLFIGFISEAKWKVQYSCGHVGITEPYRAENSSGLCGKCANALPTTVSHGMSKTPTYNSYHSMQRRCYEETNNRYSSYGGKGVGVCPRWLESFENFFEDMGECPEGWSLERKDVNLDYCPENCIWADAITQANNRTTNILIVNKEGEKWSLRRWCDILGKDYKAAWYNLRNKNIPIELILGEGYLITQMS